MVEDKSHGVPVSRPGSFADTNERAKESGGGGHPIARGLLSSAVVTAGVGALSLSDVDALISVVRLLVVLFVLLPVASAVLFARGERYGAKVLFGVWLGLLVPAPFMVWLLAMFASMF
jgi:hypothetical protein